MQETPIDPSLYPAGTLKQRMLTLVTGVPIFNMQFVKNAFPNTHEKALYRAIRELLDDGSIRFIGQTGRVKSYSTVGLSHLPAIKDKAGKWFDLADLFPLVSKAYFADGYWAKTREINELFLSLNQLFLIADLDDKELVTQYREVIFKFVKIRQSLNEMTAIVDILLNHPTMQGDPKLFKRIFAGNAPDPETKNDFKRWLGQFKKVTNAFTDKPFDGTSSS